ncbi:Nuclease [Carnimonas sp. LMG 33810]
MRSLMVAMLLALPCGQVLAAPSQCPDVYADGIRPDIAGQEVCYDGYATLYQQALKGPIYSAEHLTREAVERSKQLKRQDSFHPDTRIPDGPKPEDYHATGYDRGHMVPQADAGTRHAKHDTYSMINMTPQTPSLNRHAWNYVERGARRLTQVFGDVYVVTGAVYGSDPERLPRGEAVPTYLWKAVYIPTRHQCRVYTAPNTAQSKSQVMSLSQFVEQTGIEPFKEGLCTS